MKIKRFVAPDMRQALKKVKETLGADAVILSNKRVEQGVELVAAVDFDEAAILNSATLAVPQASAATGVGFPQTPADDSWLASTPTAAAPAPRASAGPEEPKAYYGRAPAPAASMPETKAPTFKEVVDRSRPAQAKVSTARPEFAARTPSIEEWVPPAAAERAPVPPMRPQREPAAAARPASVPEAGMRRVAPAPAVVPAQAAAPAARAPQAGAQDTSSILDEIRREMASLRSAVYRDANEPVAREPQARESSPREPLLRETAAQETAPRESDQRQRVSKQIARRLQAMEIYPDLVKTLTDRVSQLDDPNQAWRRVLSEVVAGVPVMGRDLLDERGVVALVGTAGVGKTTTLAKLAARFCMRHGHRQLALITADGYRIGAEEQLHAYGRILDVPVRAVSTPQDLNAALDAFADRRLVLIDTAGVGRKDLRVNELQGLFAKSKRAIQCLLTIDASSQVQTQIQAVRSFQGLKPMGCILTKLDEAGSLGGVISLLIKTGIPFAYATDGQKVPEDIHVARPQSLVASAVELLRGSNDPAEPSIPQKTATTREQLHV